MSTDTTKIILLNFSKKDAATVASAGFQVDRGFIGPYREGDNYAEFYSPHPFYEYDILVYNSYIPANLAEEFVNKQNLARERGSLQTLKRFTTPPHVRIAFIGGESGKAILNYLAVPK